MQAAARGTHVESSDNSHDRLGEGGSHSARRPTPASHRRADGRTEMKATTAPTRRTTIDSGHPATGRARTNFLIFALVTIGIGWIGVALDTATDAPRGNSTGMGLWLIVPALTAIALYLLHRDGGGTLGLTLRFPHRMVTGMVSLLGVFAGHRHMRRQRDGPPGQQQVPVHPAERQLAPVVDLGLFEQGERADAANRVLAGQRLGVVVEVDEQALAVAGLHEAVGVPVEASGHRLAAGVLEEVVREDLHREVRDGDRKSVV